MIIRIAIILLTVRSVAAFGQLVTVPTNDGTQKVQRNARTKQLEAMQLPFWDDFSFSNSAIYPNDTLWEYAKSVWLSYGSGINPPSMGVAAFDGIDSIGRPYNVNDVLAKGIADRMISRPLRLDLVPVGERNSVYLSFYYQFQGNGEPPDAGDQLALLFKNESGGWETVWTLENDGTLDPSVFTQILIPITEAKFFHESFQFRFHAFGRLSGPYDTWNLDYIYLNKGRTPADTSYPDRTITRPLTSLFSGYTSIPLRHFLTNPAANTINPKLTVHNLEFTTTGSTDSTRQPLDWESIDEIRIFRNQTEVVSQHNQGVTEGFTIEPLEFRTAEISKIPLLDDLQPTDSAAVIKFKLWINSKDNELPPDGDYFPSKYAPVDFRHNDTTEVVYNLSNYYAYDDGNAEYGAGLNQPGARLAYLFEMKNIGPDTIVAIDFYFPKFGDESTQSIEVQILRDLSGDPGATLYKESTIIQRKAQNEFWRYVPSRFVGVQGSFYVGWRQLSSSVIAVGLDKNTNSGNKIYFNVNDTWENNTLLSGSLMIRPVFGKGDGIFTGVDENDIPSVLFYPNPNSGTFHVSGSVRGISMFDITGRPVDISTEENGDVHTVYMRSKNQGIYFLRVLTNRGIVTHRVVVR